MVFQQGFCGSVVDFGAFIYRFFSRMANYRGEAFSDILFAKYIYAEPPFMLLLFGWGGGGGRIQRMATIWTYTSQVIHLIM